MTRFLVLGLIWWSALTVRVGAETPVVRENGVCRFVLHHYDLSSRDQATVNQIIGELLKEHERAFDFTASGDLRIQIRIFGRAEDFVRFAQTNHVFPEGRSVADSLTNLAGFYSTRDREVVTWRQSNPPYLANTILHECSHAIMTRQFRTLPVWLCEGTAVYFEYPRYMRDANDELLLKSKWMQIKEFLDDGKLPNLREFLNISNDGFRAQPSARVYTISWSLVQLLMSTPENRRAMNEMLRKYQIPSRTGPDCAALLNAAYPGGLAKLDKDWRAWIARGAANVLGQPAK